jgi:hypothetical protein
MMGGSLERMRVQERRGVAIFKCTSFYSFWCILDPYTRFIHVETNNKLILEIKFFLSKCYYIEFLFYFLELKNKF